MSSKKLPKAVQSCCDNQMSKPTDGVWKIFDWNIVYNKKKKWKQIRLNQNWSLYPAFLLIRTSADVNTKSLISYYYFKFVSW